MPSLGKRRTKDVEPDKAKDDKLNALGFSKASYDEKTDAIVLPAAIRKKILSEFPKDYKVSWKYYIEGIWWLVGYMIVFAFTMYYQYQFSISYFENGDVSNRIKAVLLSPINAWSLTGIIITGHDAIHGTFAPKGTTFGKIVNHVISYLTMDLFAVSSWIWNKEHTMHHKNVNVEGVDDMYIRGDNIITEELWAVSTILRYWFCDFKELFFNWNMKSQPLTILGRKLIIASGSYFRFYCMFYKFNNGDSAVLFCNFFWGFAILNYVGFLSHSIPVRSKGQTNDYFIWAMRETWDIFPRSGFMNFLHCGIGGHCSHHVFPYLPRSLYQISAKVLTKYCKDEYREINTLRDELWLFWNRHTQM